VNSSGGYPLFVQLRPSNIDAAAGGEEILKDLSFTGYEPDFRIPESFSGEIQASVGMLSSTLLERLKIHYIVGSGSRHKRPC